MDPASAEDFTAVETDRLLLRVPRPDDVPELFELYADPAVWRDDPVTRHETPVRTERLVHSWRAAWERDGLGIWVGRRPDDGMLVGIGGCAVRQGVAWNLGYRLRPRFWGRGHAQEIIAAALAAAHRLRPDLPVTAYLVAGNERSQRATERAGLRLVWSGPDAGNPDPQAVRLLYADRDLAADVVDVLTRD